MDVALDPTGCRAWPGWLLRAGCAARLNPGLESTKWHCREWSGATSRVTTSSGCLTAERAVGAAGRRWRQGDWSRGCEAVVGPGDFGGGRVVGLAELLIDS